MFLKVNDLLGRMFWNMNYLCDRASAHKIKTQQTNMAPADLIALGRKNVKSSANKKAKTTSMERRAQEAYWWDGEQGGDTNRLLDTLPSIESQLKDLPKNAGMMKIFKKSCGIKLSETTTLCEVDENRKICVTLDDAQYMFMFELEKALERTLINQLKMLNPSYGDSELKSVVRESEQTGKKYLKTKVQLLGMSRTMGVDAEGKTVVNPVDALSVSGTKLRARVRIDGVYVGKEMCGLITKVDMFKVVSVPDAEAMEEEKSKRMEDMDAKRLQMLEDL